MFENVEVNTEVEAITAGKNGGAAAHEVLLKALENAKGYSMKTAAAIKLLYEGDTRSADKVKNSFASVKTHCWTKSDVRVEYADSGHTVIKAVGKRVKGTDKYQPFA